MTLRRIASILATLALFAVLAACDGATDEEPSSDAPTSVTITAADAGTRVTLAQGGELEVVLEANPSTGFSWTVEEVDEAVLIQEGEPEYVTQDESVVGSPADQTTRFAAAGSGETPLSLIYHRAWEEGVEPVDRFEVTVIVE